MTISSLSTSLQYDVSLKSLNTFGIDARASACLSVSGLDDLLALRQDATLSALPRLVLGGGSNLVLTGDFAGLVLWMRARGIELVGEDAGHRYVKAAAGESWHGLVLWTLAQGLGGLENLAMIPGSVGAAPIQNIGAYGAELKDCFFQASVYDFDSAQVRVLGREQCQFGYRDSIFKQALRERFAILDVTFALPRAWQSNLGYAELAREVASLPTAAAPTPQDIGMAVMAIRSRKLPDPASIGNAGSFFKNPLVSAATRQALMQRFPALVSYAQDDGSWKLAAGWLIEQCGWKGRSLGNAGVYEKQALVLVNRGGATGAEVMALARAIQADVSRRFGVTLEPEPVLV